MPRGSARPDLQWCGDGAGSVIHGTAGPPPCATELTRPKHRSHVVLIAHHFPPSAAAGAVRAAWLTSRLMNAGFDVDVIRSASPLDGNRPPRNFEGARVFTLPARRGLREFFVGAYRTLRRAHPRGGWTGHKNRTDSTTAGSGELLQPTALRGVRRVVLSLLRIPDDHNGFTVGAAIAASRLATRRNSLIVSTAPPFSAHLAAAAAAVLRGVPLVLDYRDPWQAGVSKSPASRSRLSESVETWLEAVCLRASSRICVVSDHIARDLEDRFGTNVGARVAIVRNGIPADATPGLPRPKHGPIRILHAGSIYMGRDPRPFMRALASLRATGGDTYRGRPIEVEFIGDCSVYRGAPLERWIAEYGLASMVKLSPPVARRVALDRIRNSDVLLLLAQEQPSSVPLKLYDYLGVGRPIVALVDAGGDSAEVLQSLGSSFLVFDDSPLAIVQALKSAMAVAIDDAPEPWAALEDRTRTKKLEFAADARLHGLLQAVETVSRLSRPRRGPALVLGVGSRSSGPI